MTESVTRAHKQGYGTIGSSEAVIGTSDCSFLQQGREQVFTEKERYYVQQF